MNSTAVNVATTSTTNITGLRIMTRGSSLRNAWPRAGTKMAVSVMVTALRSRALTGVVASIGVPLEKGACVHREVFDQWAEGERREEGETTDDQDYAREQPDEQRPRGGERAG